MRATNAWWAFLILAMSTPEAIADEYFLDCEAVLSLPAFRPLRSLIDRSDDKIEARLCMALAPPREYVITTSDQIYYCSSTGKPGCERDTIGYYYPNLRVVRQFSGFRNKQYVLLSSGYMSKGVNSSGYLVFQLVPKSKDQRGYVVYRLHVGDVFGDSDDKCEDLVNTDEAVEITNVNLDGEGTRAVKLSFGEAVTTCETGETGFRTVSFSVVEGIFKSVPANAPRKKESQ